MKSENKSDSIILKGRSDLLERPFCLKVARLSSKSGQHQAEKTPSETPFGNEPHG